MGILVIHGSPNKNGNAAELAEKLMDGKAYQTLDLADYKVYGYGQHFEDDQFAQMYGMEDIGMAVNSGEAKALSGKI